MSHDYSMVKHKNIIEIKLHNNFISSALCTFYLQLYRPIKSTKMYIIVCFSYITFVLYFIKVFY